MKHPPDGHYLAPRLNFRFAFLCSFSAAAACFRGKGPLDPLIAGGDLLQGLVLQLDLLQMVRQEGLALTYPGIVPCRRSNFPFKSR